MTARIIDVHTHLVPPCYRAALERAGRLMEDGFPCPNWTAGGHLAHMEQMGIRTSILSISSPHQVSADLTDGVEVTRQCNDYMAELCRAHPEAFRFAACLPLPLVEESVREACRALDELGAAALKFPTNAQGLYPGDPRLDPLMDELDRRRAVVLLHPCKPPAVPQNCFTAGSLPLLEFMGDTTRAVINLMTRNAAEKWPHVRFVVPHVGSFLPPLVERLAGITQVLADHGMGTAIEPRSSLDCFWFDVAGNSLEASIAGLLTVTTPDRLLYGGDYPHTPTPVVAENFRRLEEHPLTAPHLEDILFRNGERLFGL